MAEEKKVRLEDLAFIKKEFCKTCPFSRNRSLCCSISTREAATTEKKMVTAGSSVEFPSLIPFGLYPCRQR